MAIMAPSAASACTAVSSFPAGRPAASSSARPCAAASRVGVVCCASTAAKGGNGKWWAPLLGWSGKADYLEAPALAPAPAPAPAQQEEAARRPFVGVMTEEKARELRARMAQTESFHDAMYHSAIASRLARSA